MAWPACCMRSPSHGVNGSGKHDNWSITTDDGINLLDPGKAPHENIQFLLVLTCILKAVDEHADLLRLSAASTGNDHRLGKRTRHRPAIISVFLGEQLQDVLTQLIETGFATHSLAGEALKTGVKLSAGIRERCHRPQPYIAVRFHRQQVRVPYGWFQ